jgi:DNA-directed RNA polymerase II subunit RPB2
VYLNQRLVGVHSNPRKLHEKLTQDKRMHTIDYQTTCIHDIHANEYRIHTDSGRCIRPLYIVTGGKLGTLQFQKKQGQTNNFKINDWYGKDCLGELLEYVEVEEANHLYIAKSQQDLNKNKMHTHCEIHPSLMLSLYTNTIPFVNHNQSPRVVFSGQQGKQAIGIYATNFNARMDKNAYALHYPQKNLVSTEISKYMNKNTMPNGENVIVAIATYTGYNQEDSIIINKDSIDRGLFNLTYFRSVSESAHPLSQTDSQTSYQSFISNSETFEKNNAVQIQQKLDEVFYRTIDENGLPIKNTRIQEGDAIIGKVEQRKKLYNDDQNVFTDTVYNTTFTDTTLQANKTNVGFVDKVNVNTSGEKVRVDVRLRKSRRPVIGDKLASCHGQKGCIGLVLPQVEMPFTKDGLVPDIIINPHAFPSRMTIGQLLECILSKVACKIGCQMFASPFERRDNEEYFNFLEENGIERHSNEVMYNARTGEQMKSDIFIGPTFYYRLKHMVDDKINYRSRDGAIDYLTKQPTGGRTKNGGLRIGEMETNSIVAHGLSSFLKESLMDRSDGVVKSANAIEKSHMYVDEFGDEMISNSKKQIFKSYHHRSISETVRLIVPQAFTILKRELGSLSIKMQFKHNSDDLCNDSIHSDSDLCDDDIHSDSDS